MNNPFEIEKLEAAQLPELQGLKEKQLQIVKDNPFVTITDNATYEAAKKSRTALVSARTDIEKQDKLIASKIKKFREMVSGFSSELIGITKPHEEKQQDEVKRYEAIKEAEKAEKERKENERKDAIKNAIQAIYERENAKVESLNFEMIDTLKVDWEQNLFKTDVSQFEEFELDFNEKLGLLKNAFSLKETALIEKENQRLEAERLKAEREKLEAEKAELEAKAKDLEQKRIDILLEKRIDTLFGLGFKFHNGREYILEIPEKLYSNFDIIDLRTYSDEKFEKEINGVKNSINRIAEESEKAEEKRIADEAAAAEKAKADAERLEALKPEKEKAIDFANNLVFKAPIPEFKDQDMLTHLGEFISDIEKLRTEFINKIKNFK